MYTHLPQYSSILLVTSSPPPQRGQSTTYWCFILLSWHAPSLRGGSQHQYHCSSVIFYPPCDTTPSLPPLLYTDSGVQERAPPLLGSSGCVPHWQGHCSGRQGRCNVGRLHGLQSELIGISRTANSYKVPKGRTYGVHIPGRLSVAAILLCPEGNQDLLYAVVLPREWSVFCEVKMWSLVWCLSITV